MPGSPGRPVPRARQLTDLPSARTTYGMGDATTSRAAATYRGLAADERQEFRLPALLKEHLGRVVAVTGQSITEYITEAVAERVTQDLAANTEWALTVDEQVSLLKILANDAGPSERANAAAERARALFGGLSTSHDR